MAVESPGWANQASTYGAEQTRRAVFFGYTSGVKGVNDLLVTQNGAGALNVNVATGEALIPGTSTTTQGLYYGRASSTSNLTISTPSGSNPRIDLLCATVDDSGYSGGANDWKLQVVAGTPTTGATLVNLSGAAALPTSSLLIAYILVPTSTTAIVSADISDRRVYASDGLNGPGNVLATVQYNPGGRVVYTATTSTTAVDTTNLATAFTAPITGRVLYSFDCAAYGGAITSTVLYASIWNIAGSAELNTAYQRLIFYTDPNNMFLPLHYEVLVTGLTAGSSYNLCPAFGNTASLTFYAGGGSSGGPFLCKVVAA